LIFLTSTEHPIVPHPAEAGKIVGELPFSMGGRAAHKAFTTPYPLRDKINYFSEFYL
jgi:hypothetical protein